ncbi:MAG: GGDEF domain-containing protein [Treponema sp.]|nr:GGDEF domain-containing protein [Treponema sp.]
MISRLEKFKNLMLYAGLTKEEYKAINKERIAQNRSSLLTVTIITILGFAILTVLSIFKIGAFKDFGLIYFVCFLFFSIYLIFCFTLSEKYPLIIRIGTYFFMVSILSFGIYLALVIGVKERTVSLIAFMMAIPSLFLVSPLGYTILFFICQATYITLSYLRQEEFLFLINLENVVVFGCISLILGFYVMCVKAAKLKAENKNDYLIRRDQLTGIYNRRYYERVLAGPKDISKMAVILFDLNGLKIVNDQIGHEAGDELIKGAAACINEVFKNYGDNFRIGGDEFVTLLSDDYNLDLLIEDFENLYHSWKGKHNQEILISYGIARASENPDKNLPQLVNLADKLMYENKAEFYKTHKSIDRRNRD